MAEREVRREFDGVNRRGVAEANANGATLVWASACGMKGHCWAGAETAAALDSEAEALSEGMLQWCAP